MLLRLDGVMAYYGQQLALDHLSLEVDSGQIVSLLGANASGKTTTLKTILGLTTVRAGRISLDDEGITGMATDVIVRKGVAIVPENRRLFPKLTVGENLRIVVSRQAKGETFERNLAFVQELFPVLQRHDRWMQKAGTMSGGEQQQIAMARALLLHPRLLLLDEPSMGMSVKLIVENFSILQRVADKGIGILMVEQNVKMALTVASYGYVLQEGRVIEHGNARDLLGSELIQRSYLGEFITE